MQASLFLQENLISKRFRETGVPQSFSKSSLTSYGIIAQDDFLENFVWVTHVILISLGAAELFILRRVRESFHSPVGESEGPGGGEDVDEGN